MLQALRVTANAPPTTISTTINSRRRFSKALRRKKRPIIPTPKIDAKATGATEAFWLVVVVPVDTLVVMVRVTTPTPFALHPPFSANASKRCVSEFESRLG